MTNQDRRIRRRRFLAVTGGSVVTLAGCLSGDSEPGSDGSSPETTPSSRDTGTSRPTGNPNTDTEQSTAQPTETVEDITSEDEENAEMAMGEDYGNWIETKESMLQIPEWAKDGEEDNWNESDEGALGYRRFVHIFMSERPPSAGTFIEHHIGMSDEITDGEFDSDTPYRIVALFSRIEELDDLLMNTYGVPVKSDAVEQFLQDNVHGIIDHEPETSQELLDYARQ